jgi:hypothetical protein
MVVFPDTEIAGATPTVTHLTVELIPEQPEPTRV